MKRLLLLCLVFGCLVSCGNKSESSVAIGASSSTVTELSKSSENPTEELNKMCNYLESKNVVSGESLFMAYSIINAIAGTSYFNRDVQIYLYENEAPKSVTYEISGTEITVEFDATNGRYVLTIDGNKENYTNLIAEFKNYKEA